MKVDQVYNSRDVAEKATKVMDRFRDLQKFDLINLVYESYSTVWISAHTEQTTGSISGVKHAKERVNEREAFNNCLSRRYCFLWRERLDF